MKGDNMISYILAWGIWTVVLGTIMLFWVMVRKKSISATKFGAYLIYAIIMICVGIVTIILNKYDGVCGMLCGVIMFMCHIMTEILIHDLRYLILII